MWDLRVIDLMQGPVYGIETEETLLDDRLRTIFNYDLWVLTPVSFIRDAESDTFA